jgi:hypothetical protein
MPIKKKVTAAKPKLPAVVPVVETTPKAPKAPFTGHWTDPDAHYAADDQSIAAQLWRMRPDR